MEQGSHLQAKKGNLEETNVTDTFISALAFRIVRLFCGNFLL